MALIGVGIVKDLVISKVTYNKNEQGQSVDVTFTESGSNSEEEVDIFTSSSTEAEGDGKQNNIRLYAPSMKTFGTEEVKDGTVLMNELFGTKTDISGLKPQLTHILEAYLTKDKITWEPFKGTDIKSGADVVSKITTEKTYNKVVENLLTQFEGMLKPVIGPDSKKIVVKFLRKSDTSNFPVLANKKINWNPFIASMDDTSLVDKLKYNDWEKANHKDSNVQTLGEADANPADLAAQNEAVNSVFG